MAAPATTPEPEKPLGTLTQQCTVQAGTSCNQQLLAGVKDLYTLTQLLKQGAFFCAYIYIQCPLLLTSYMLMSPFCFKTCLLF